MARLKDMRHWARGEHVQGLPPRRFKRPAPAPAPTIKRSMAPDSDVKPPKPAYGKARYKISADGTDALVLFGKHRGQKLSDIADKDATYCDFIVREEFPADLKDVARHQKRESRERAKKIKLFEDED